MIVRCQQWSHKQVLAMESQVRREISHAQSPIRRPVVFMRSNERSQRLGMLAVVAAMFFGDSLGGVSRMVMQRENQIAVSFGIVGLQSDCLAICGDGLVEQSFLSQG